MIMLMVCACGPSTSAPNDASTDDGRTKDVSSTDANVIRNGFGVLSGDCGTLEVALDSSQASVLQAQLDLANDGYDDGDKSKLSLDAQNVIDSGTAGGSSSLSEALAMDFLVRCDRATLIKTETEIDYMSSNSKMADLLVFVNGENVGVSVTRAVGFPKDEPYLPADAEFLADKIADINNAESNASESNSWERSIVVVLAYSQMHAESMRTAWSGFTDSEKGDTIIIIVTTNGDDGAIY